MSQVTVADRHGCVLLDATAFKIIHIYLK